MKKLIIFVLALCLITPPVFFVMYSKDTVKAAEFTPPVVNTDPNCTMTTNAMLDVWHKLYPESKFVNLVDGALAQRAVKLYNEQPPRSGVIATSIYGYNHPKAKGVQTFFDNNGCLTGFYFLPEYLYNMLIGKAK